MVSPLPTTVRFLVMVGRAAASWYVQPRCTTSIAPAGAPEIALRSAVTLHGTAIVVTAWAAGAAASPAAAVAMAAAPPAAQRPARPRRPVSQLPGRKASVRDM